MQDKDLEAIMSSRLYQNGCSLWDRGLYAYREVKIHPLRDDTVTEIWFLPFLYI